MKRLLLVALACLFAFTASAEERDIYQPYLDMFRERVRELSNFDDELCGLSGEYELRSTNGVWTCEDPTDSYGTMDLEDGTRLLPSLAFSNDTDTGLFMSSVGVGTFVGNNNYVFEWGYNYVKSYMPHRFADGSIGAPSITFTLETDTGFWSNNTDQVALSLGGVGRYYFTPSYLQSTAIRVNNVTDSTTPQYTFLAEPDAGLYFDYNVLNEINLVTEGLVRFAVNASGITLADTLGLLNVGHIDLDLDAAPTSQEGRMFWDDGDGTLAIGMAGDEVTLQVGQEILVRVSNKSGVDIKNGDLVYETGSQGNRLTVERCDYTDPDKIHLLGMATEDIDNNGNGFITVTGQIRGNEAQPINTIGYAEGAKLYMNSAGGWSDTHPTSHTQAVVIIGHVIKVHATQGVIMLPHFESFTLGNNYDGIMRQSIMNKNTGTSAAGAFTIVDDDGHRVSLGLTNSGNTVFGSHIAALYNEGHGEFWFLNDGNVDFVWKTDVGDTHDYSYTEKMRLDALGNLDIALRFTTHFGSQTFPAHSFTTEPGTGMYMYQADKLRFAVDGNNQFGLNLLDAFIQVPLLHANGTLAAPAISFIGDPNTGIWSEGDTGALRFTFNGTEGLWLTANGAGFAGATYTYRGSLAATGHSFSNDSNTGMWSPAADQLALATAGKNVISFGADQRIYLSDDGSGIGPGTYLLPDISWATDTDTGIWKNGANTFAFVAQGAAVFYIHRTYNSSNVVFRTADGSASQPGYAFVYDLSTGFYSPGDSDGTITYAAVTNDVFDFTPLGISMKSGAEATPSYGFIDNPDTGFYYSTGGVTIGAVVNASRKQYWSGSASGFTVPIHANKGSVTVPGMTFWDDTNTGLYILANDDDLHFTAGGVHAATLNAAGLTLPGRLYVTERGDDDNPSIAWANDPDTGIYQHASSDGYMNFVSNGSLIFQVKPGAYTIYQQATFGDSTGDATAPSMRWYYDTNTGIYQIDPTGNDDTIAFTTGGSRAGYWDGNNDLHVTGRVIFPGSDVQIQQFSGRVDTDDDCLFPSDYHAHTNTVVCATTTTVWYAPKDFTVTETISEVITTGTAGYGCIIQVTLDSVDAGAPHTIATSAAAGTITRTAQNFTVAEGDKLNVQVLDGLDALLCDAGTDPRLRMQIFGYYTE
jgi:hypothetical protein